MSMRSVAAHAPIHCAVCRPRASLRCCTASAASRRQLLSLTASLALSLAWKASADGGEGVLAALQAEAASAFAAQDFPTADAALTKLIQLQPSACWLEGRAQVRVDAKAFSLAVSDYEAALAMLPAELDDGGAVARLRSGRALAYEGVSRWSDALADYDAALDAAARGGFSPDPYILNSRANVLASLQRWSEAREAYQQSAAIFQSSSGYRRGASTTSRLDGAIYAAANAALMRCQLGDDAGAAQELSAVARRAPNSADARAALAALNWALGRPEQAEEAWERACTRAEGCARYRDADYVTRIRRWPPRMVQLLGNFLQLRTPTPP